MEFSNEYTLSESIKLADKVFVCVVGKHASAYVPISKCTARRIVDVFAYENIDTPEFFLDEFSNLYIG